jgi:hypothetical protein
MVTTWTNVLNGAATTVGATPGDAVPATLLADVLQISNSGSGLDTTLRDVRDGDGDTIPLQVSKQAVMLTDGAVWPYGDSTFFSAGMNGILIPFYIYPNNPYSDETCTRLLGLIRQYRGRVPCLVILNPGSGPGSAMDGNYSAFIKLIQAAGGKVAGYVSTAYAGTIDATRTEAAVKADVDTWLTLYADTPIDTIFFDEMNYDLGTNNEYVALYKRYTDYCHARNLAPVIANPGTNQQGAWFAERTADIIVVAETGTWPTESDMLGAYVGGHIDYKTSLRAAMVYGQSTLVPGKVRQLAKYVQWIYATGDALSPNPWDSLSAHVEQIFTILAGRDDLNVRDFGAIGDDVTDDSVAFLAAIATGKDVHIPAGTYFIGNVSLKPVGNQRIFGAGMDKTIIRFASAAANPLFFRRFDDPYIAKVEFSDFTIKGDWEAVKDDLGPYPFLIYRVTDLRILRVGIEYARNIAIACRICDHVLIDGCRLRYIARDGINTGTCTSAIITNNDIAHVDDDAIAHASSSDDVIPMGQSVVVSGNVITNSQGPYINASRIVVTNNTIDRVTLHGLALTGPYHSSHAMIVANNTITNVFNRQTIDGLSNGGEYIGVTAEARIGSLAAIPGENDTATGTVIEPYTYFLNSSTTLPIPGHHHVLIANNVCGRTLPLTAAYSTYGYGLWFNRYGWTDPVIDNFVATRGRGMRIDGSFRHVKVDGNKFFGVREGYGLYFGPDLKTQNFVLSRNEFVDCLGLEFDATLVKVAQDIELSDNLFDVDPYLKASDRLTAGAWDTPSVTTALRLRTVTGVRLIRNKFKNCNGVLDSSANQFLESNTLFCDPASSSYSASNKGIGVTSVAGERFRYVIEGSDPTSSAFGTVLNHCVREATSIPTTGKYVAGHWVHNSARTVSSGKILLGWARLVTGSAHVSGTDWSPLYATIS